MLWVNIHACISVHWPEYGEECLSFYEWLVCVGTEYAETIKLLRHVDAPSSACLCLSVISTYIILNNCFVIMQKRGLVIDPKSLENLVQLPHPYLPYQDCKIFMPKTSKKSKGHFARGLVIDPKSLENLVQLPHIYPPFQGSKIFMPPTSKKLKGHFARGLVIDPKSLENLVQLPHPYLPYQGCKIFYAPNFEKVKGAFRFPLVHPLVSSSRYIAYSVKMISCDLNGNMWLNMCCSSSGCHMQFVIVVFPDHTHYFLRNYKFYPSYW